jgi:hypothetical protein
MAQLIQNALLIEKIQMATNLFLGMIYQPSTLMEAAIQSMILILPLWRCYLEVIFDPILSGFGPNSYSLILQGP